MPVEARWNPRITISKSCRLRHRFADALSLVLQDVPVERRNEHIAGLLAAEQAGRGSGRPAHRARGRTSAGRSWAQVQPGRVASVWPAVIREEAPAATSDALLAATVEWLGRQGVRLAQVLLAVDASRQRTELSAHGFANLADLFYMVCLAGRFPDSEPDSRVQFEPVSPTAPARLAEIVEPPTSGRSIAHSSTACATLRTCWPGIGPAALSIRGDG